MLNLWRQGMIIFIFSRTLGMMLRHLLLWPMLSCKGTNIFFTVKFSVCHFYKLSYYPGHKRKEQSLAWCRCDQVFYSGHHWAHCFSRKSWCVGTSRTISCLAPSSGGTVTSKPAKLAAFPPTGKTAPSLFRPLSFVCPCFPLILGWVGKC